MAQPEVVVSPWTPALITALFAGVAVVITALGTVLVKMWQAKNTAEEARLLVVKAKEALETESKTIHKKVDAISRMVDGQYTEMLMKMAAMKRAVADRTGHDFDIRMADEAEAEVGARVLRMKQITSDLEFGRRRLDDIPIIIPPEPAKENT